VNWQLTDRKVRTRIDDNPRRNIFAGCVGAIGVCVPD
jgi:hypothetical protein